MVREPSDAPGHCTVRGKLVDEVSRRCRVQSRRKQTVILLILLRFRICRYSFVISIPSCLTFIMKMFLTIISSLFVTAAVAAPAPSPTLQQRATEQCGQYQSQSSGAYTLYTNGWGWAGGTGSQCSEIDSLSGSTLSWDTTWTWSGGSTQVKSYSNVEISISQKQLSTYTGMATTWHWSYTGSSLACNGTNAVHLSPFYYLT